MCRGANDMPPDARPDCSHLVQKIAFEIVEDRYAAVPRHNQAALCLSGFGIRRGPVRDVVGKGVT